jgi:hypothetical protein
MEALMTLAKMSALVAGFIGAMALGVWVGPSITDRLDRPADRTAAPATASAPVEITQKARAPRAARAKAAARATASPSAVAIDLSAPALQKRLKPILNPGADLSIASSGFRDAEQFATVAHAARNTEVPFMLLKHRVLNEGKTLPAAIRELKPELDSAVEADRARREARQDVASLAS